MRLLLLTLLLVPLAAGELNLDVGDDCWDCEEESIDTQSIIILASVMAFLLLLVAIIVAASN